MVLHVGLPNSLISVNIHATPFSLFLVYRLTCLMYSSDDCVSPTAGQSVNRLREIQRQRSSNSLEIFHLQQSRSERSCHSLSLGLLPIRAPYRLTCINPQILCNDRERVGRYAGAGRLECLL